MINKPNISIIVPIYNSENYLHRCIDSILAQTYSDFELLLINDGSVDSSGTICDEYAKKDTRIRVFHKENGGVSSARNVGLDNALGKWVSFIDSDDWVDNTYFDHLLKDENDVELRAAGYKMEDSKSLKWNEYLPKNEVFLNDDFKLFYEKHISSGLVTAPWCKLYLLSVIRENKIDFDPNLSFGEDTIFTIKYLKKINSVFVTNYSEYYRRDTDGSLCDQVSFEKWARFLTIYENEILSILNKYESSFLIKKHWAKLCITFFFFGIKDIYMRRVLKRSLRIKI